MGLLKNILDRLLPFRDIVKDVDGKRVLYLRRYFLWRNRKGDGSGDGGGVFLHYIARSDEDPDPHDHPWDFTSLILAGGYTNEEWAWEVTKLFDGPDSYAIFVDGRNHQGNQDVKPGMLVKRKAEHVHRVLLKGRPAWTLVFAGQSRREWGFLTEDGWKSWRDYLNIPMPSRESLISPRVRHD